VTAGYVVFRVAQQAFALRLEEVREIVRLDRLEPLPGMLPPMAGVLVVRGNPLPVFDLRAEDTADGHGDVLVIGAAGDLLGVAVEQVTAVLSADDLPASATPVSKAMPSYVVDMRESATGPVLLVDLPRMLDGCAEGWAGALPGLSASAQT
jgi:purine-binding chemotaxis protein CheW